MALIDELPRPAIIGHRGASARAPENTLAAFRLAVEHGADGIELDAKLSADGQVVVIHSYTSDVNQESILSEHKAGRRVNAWTVNEPGEILRLFKIGIDGIITDDPLLARQALEER